jgi:uncharacterized Zn finger protein
MTSFPVSETIISQFATGESYARGDDYARSGRVSDLSVRDNVLSASVQGSEPAPYTVRVSVHDGVVTDATCTCLYGYGGWCKHIVAALIVATRQPEEVAERPSLAGRLDLLEPDALKALVLRLVEHAPDVEAAVERLLPVVAGDEADVGAVVSVDAAAIEARVAASVHSLDRMRRSDAYWHVGGVASEVERELLPIRALLDSGQSRAALDILRAVLDTWTEQWTWLDDSDGDASRVFYTAEPLLVEALLAPELSRDDLDWWVDHIDAWIAELSDYGVDVFYDAYAAATSGWDAPELLAVLRGESDVLEPPDDEMLEERDELLAIRLRVLARNGRDDEALRLAAAAGHVNAYATALVRRGEIDEAVQYALERVTRPADAHEIALALHAAGSVDEALRVAERGIGLAEPDPGYITYDDAPGLSTRAALSLWLRGVAEEAGNVNLARQAAETAVREAPELETWHEARRLSGDDWAGTRERLRTDLRTAARGSRSGRVDICLEEGWIEDAIHLVLQHAGYALIARVADAAVEDQPDWVIATSRSHAETIMDGGHSNAYGDAARWLARMKAASRASGKEAEFRAYLAETIDKHHRKYKLVPLLREVQQR